MFSHKFDIQKFLPIVRCDEIMRRDEIVRRDEIR